MKIAARSLPPLLFLFTAVLGLSYTALAEVPMKPQPVTQTAFTVIGIEARTNNAKESVEGGTIPQMWQRFYMQGTIDTIPGKTDSDIIAVYTDYANGADGDYTFVLGARVKPGTKPPAGLVAVDVPAGKYLEFTSEQGALPLVIPQAWRHIYEYFQGAGTPPRAFKADYEVYDSAMDPNSASAKLNIGVK